jgi:hypothetical protein
VIAKKDIEIEARTILSRIMPSLQIARLEAGDYFDWEGNEALSLKIVASQRPPREEASKMVVFVDQLRTWLALRDDERFPYVRLLTESEERDLLHAE